MALERSVGSPLPPTHAHHALLPSHPPFTPPTTLHLADDCRSTDSATAATLVAEISDGARATTSTSFWDHFSRISPLCATLPHTRRAMCSTVLSTLAHRGHAHIVSGPSCVERTVAAPLGVRDRIADRIDASRHAPEHRQGGRLCVNTRPRAPTGGAPVCQCTLPNPHVRWVACHRGAPCRQSDRRPPRQRCWGPRAT